MKPVALVLALAALPAAAHAGETACWFEQGVIVAPASIDGLAGDYILDTGAAVTQLHETKAQAAGLVDADQHGQIRIAGITLADRPFVVADLDARTYAFPTPIAGVIGADLLSAYVVEISFAPCKVAIYPRGAAPRVRTATTVLPLNVVGGVATSRAAVADGPSAVGGDFVIATGSDTAVRVAERRAAVPGAAKPQDLLPYGGTRAKLRAASFAGSLFENLEAGLADTQAEGVIGAPLLARWRLRFDFPGRKLLLAPAG